MDSRSTKRGPRQASGVPTVASVVVPFDATPAGLLAFRWSVRHAQTSGLPLIVICTEPDAAAGDDDRYDAGSGERERLIRDLVTQKRLTDPAEAGPPDLTVVVTADDPTGAVLREADFGDSVLVVGCDHHPDVGTTCGDVAVDEILRRARGTVVAVPREFFGSGRPHGHTTVVGVDGSDASACAVRFAATEAIVSGGRLRIVAVDSGANAFLDVNHEGVGPADRNVLDWASGLIGPSRRKSGLRVDMVHRIGPGDFTLVAEARSADLLVLGAGHRGAAAQGRRSVSNWCAHHAPCPVALVPATAGLPTAS